MLTYGVSPSFTHRFLTNLQAQQMEQLHTDVHSQLGQVATDMAGIMASVQHTTATLQVRR